MKIESLVARSKEIAESKLETDPEVFSRHVEGQSPHTLVIGCSDSRVVPEHIFGCEPGELFVHRNVANQVNEADASSRAVVRYAVKYLKVSNIVVLGHYGCGGVKAALSKDKSDPAIENWVSSIRDIAEDKTTELQGIGEEKNIWDRLVELSSLKQVANLTQMAEVGDALDRDELEIRALVYDIGSGLVEAISR